jgi:UDPglucose 6-dehydrogenase
MIKKILVFGAGYVGSSLGILLATKYEVVLIDTDQAKVNKINNKKAPIEEPLMQEFLDNKNLNLIASASFNNHISSTDMIILALPTNYDEKINSFNTSSLKTTLAELNKIKCKAEIVIKSTIPIGFTQEVEKEFSNLRILFVPEFLREGKALEDNLNPSRIIIGSSENTFTPVADVFFSIAMNNPKILYMNSTEAEAVKLFANNYLATRVSFFNELDSFALQNNLNAKDIINGISSDPRVGDHYNNPSFGYGGYCLPKDTKQLLANFKNIPQSIFSAVVKSNKLRKIFIAEKILQSNSNTVGIFRLVMKKNSDNYRESAIFDIIKLLEDSKQKVLIYEPLINDTDLPYNFTSDLDFFKKSCDLVVANRIENEIEDIREKVFTRDIFGSN